MKKIILSFLLALSVNFNCYPNEPESTYSTEENNSSIDKLEKKKDDYLSRINKMIVFLSNQTSVVGDIVDNKNEAKLSPFMLIQECKEYSGGCSLILQTLKDTDNVGLDGKPYTKKLSPEESISIINEIRKNIKTINLNIADLRNAAAKIKNTTDASELDDVINEIGPTKLIDQVLYNPTQSQIESGAYSSVTPLAGPFPPSAADQIRKANYSVYFPSVALINQRYSGGMCTGVIVSESAILTAAHCFCKPYAKFDNNLCQTKHIDIQKSNNKLEVVLQHEGQPTIKGITIHEKYNVDSEITPRPYDLAIIELESPIENIEPADIINYKFKFIDSNATIVGFGDSYVNTNQPMAPKNGLKASAQIGIKLCSKNDNLSFICSEFSSNADLLAGHCPGDSGGPIFVSDENGVFKIAGLITNGDDCERDSGKMYDASFNNKEYYDWLIGMKNKNSITSSQQTVSSIKKLHPVNNKDITFGPKKDLGELSPVAGKPDEYTVTPGINDGFIVVGVNAELTQHIRPRMQLEIFDENNKSVECLNVSKTDLEYAKFCKFIPSNSPSKAYNIRIKGTPESSYQLVSSHLPKAQ